MGCASSKQEKCRHCQAPYSPVSRSYSMHVVHPPQRKGDTYHVVALTSTTLGSLKLDSSNHKENGYGAIDVVETGKNENDIGDCINGIVNDKELESKEFSMGLIEAKTWSNMIEQKIPKIVPKTPVATPPGEPETINAWEMMAGLDDTSPLHNRFRSFSFDSSRQTNPLPDSPKLKLQENDNGTLTPNNKSQWFQMADDNDANPKCPELDPEGISTFRKSLEELSPDHPFYLKPSDGQKKPPSSVNNPAMDVNDAKKVDFVAKDYKRRKEKVVVYFTSLRGVRKTFEDCCHVRVILKSLGVRVDERDVSMHSGFKEELRELLGEGFSGGGLPRVFVGTKYIGGAEEMRRMHEEGQLEKVVEGCEMVDDGGGGGGGACEACGDMRFVPCETCSGSCKIYHERDEEEEEELREESEEDVEYGFQRCPDCNENGLIRCPICCD